MKISNLKINKKLITILLSSSIVLTSLTGCSSIREQELTNEVTDLKAQIEVLQKQLNPTDEVTSNVTAEENKGQYTYIGEKYYDSSYYVSFPDDDGYLRNIELNGNKGIIDVSSGKTIIAPNYKNIDIYFKYIILTRPNGKKILTKFNSKYAFVDFKDNMSQPYDDISAPYYDLTYRASTNDDDGLMCNVTLEGKKGIIDASSGRILLKPIYSKIGVPYYDLSYSITADDNDGFLCDVWIDNKKGLVDGYGFNVLVPAEYADIKLEDTDIIATDTEGLKRIIPMKTLRRK